MAAALGPNTEKCHIWCCLWTDVQVSRWSIDLFICFFFFLEMIVFVLCFGSPFFFFYILLFFFSFVICVYANEFQEWMSFVITWHFDGLHWVIRKFLFCVVLFCFVSTNTFIRFFFPKFRLKNWLLISLNVEQSGFTGLNVISFFFTLRTQHFKVSIRQMSMSIIITF